MTPTTKERISLRRDSLRLPCCIGIGQKWLLRRWANTIRGFYGEPVYLCGSALKKKNPRDYDIRVMLSDKDFALRYGKGKTNATEQWIEQGESGQWTDVRWKWSDDCVKHAKDGARHTHLNIDFQVYPKSYAHDKFGKRAKVRIDTRSEV